MSKSKVLIIFGFLWGASALAQFEVAPDHFDAEAQKRPAQRARAKTKAKPADQATPSVAAAAQPGKQGQATAISRKRQGGRSLQLAGASAGQPVGSGASSNSPRKRLQKTTTVSSLQLARKNMTESPTLR